MKIDPLVIIENLLAMALVTAFVVVIASETSKRFPIVMSSGVCSGVSPVFK
jgi:hypothetical protein